MTKARYVSYANALEANTGVVDWLSDTVQAILVRTDDYTVNLVTDTVVDDIPIGAQVATVDLTGISQTTGVISCDELVFPSVSAGAPIDALVFAENGGDSSTDRLLYYMDEFPAGMPITPDGGDIHGAIDIRGLFAL